MPTFPSGQSGRVIPSDGPYWLGLAVLSLGLAGVLALFLALSRTPVLGELFPGGDFFRAALVIHVDQSVLVWFLSMNAVVWCLTDDGRFDRWRRVSFLTALTATLGLTLAPFLADAKPLMNNYVPVLQQGFFFVMLGLLALALALRCVLSAQVLSWRAMFRGQASPLATTAATSGLALGVALLAVAGSWATIPPGIDGTLFHEYLFWGGGHSLQFAHVALLMLAWLTLARASGVDLPGGDGWIRPLLWLGVTPLLIVPLIYLRWPVEAGEFRLAFTNLMRYGGGIAVVPFSLLLLAGLRGAGAPAMEARHLRSCLWMSLLLFTAGGVLGFLIGGVNTVIPAHYHGSIVGITLALMGYSYCLLGSFGFEAPGGRLARLQPLCYGGGQLLHIAGLAVSGALGIQRKTAGAAQGLDNLPAQLAMGVMGIGGLLAVVGGGLFVWLMVRAFWRGRLPGPAVISP